MKSNGICSLFYSYPYLILLCFLMICYATAPGSTFAEISGWIIDLDDKLAAAEGSAQDKFGRSVAMDGDTIIIGAPYDDEKANNAGAAYIFAYDGISSWTLEAKLTPGDPYEKDYFGFCVDIDGDTVIIGTCIYDGMGYREGAAYIFQKISGTWTQKAKLTATPGEIGDYFGMAVSLSGDTAVIGAWGAGFAAGAAYIFERNFWGPDLWGQSKTLLASDRVASDLFGMSVSISGDTVIIGAQSDNDMGAGSGSAYIYERNEGGIDNWGEKKKLTAPDGMAWDSFGCSVAISGDIAVVGAYGDDDMGDKSGSAYAFDRNDGGTDNWGMQEILRAEGGGSFDQFGFSVAISGENVIVGALNHQSLGPGSGAAWVFKREDGFLWFRQAKLIAADGVGYEKFGTSVSVSGERFVIGASEDNGMGNKAGAAYIMKPFRFAWVTDTHIEEGTPRLIAHHQFLDDINATSATLDFAINTGDLTEAGRDTELDLFRDFVTSMTIPYYYIPGNHETRWTESASFHYNDVLGDEHFFFKHKGIYFIGVNTGVFCRIGTAHIAPEEMAW